MSLSTAEVRDSFKHKLSDWESADQENPTSKQSVEEFTTTTHTLLQDLAMRTALLQEDYRLLSIDEENQQSSQNSFTHLQSIASQAQTDLQEISKHPPDMQLKLIKSLYAKHLIPAFNLLLKLENEYIATTTHDILTKGKKLEQLETELQTLKQEKEKIRKRIFDFKRKEKFVTVVKKIKKLELQRKITKLTMHHDKLNLFFFTHHRPPELKEIKDKTDKLREELIQLEEVK